MACGHYDNVVAEGALWSLVACVRRCVKRQLMKADNTAPFRRTDGAAKRLNTSKHLSHVTAPNRPASTATQLTQYKTAALTEFQYHQRHKAHNDTMIQNFIHHFITNIRYLVTPELGPPRSCSANRELPSGILPMHHHSSPANPMEIEKHTKSIYDITASCRRCPALLCRDRRAALLPVLLLQLLPHVCRSCEFNN